MLGPYQAPRQPDKDLTVFGTMRLGRGLIKVSLPRAQRNYLSLLATLKTHKQLSPQRQRMPAFLEVVMAVIDAFHAAQLMVKGTFGDFLRYFPGPPNGCVRYDAYHVP
jgi:hypothetical protein